jgi:hypothetical protein
LGSLLVVALFTPLGFGPLSQSIPAVVCIGFLAKLWWTRELYGLQQAAFVAWFITALTVQLVSGSPWVWIAGYTGQVVLAVALIAKNQLGDIY